MSSRRNKQPARIPLERPPQPRSSVVGAALDAPTKGPQLRYVLTINGNDRGQVSWATTALADNVTRNELVDGLVACLANVKIGKNPLEIIERQDLVQAKQHKEDTLRDYPAMRFHPGKGWYLCAACLDVYTETAAPSGEFLELPPEMSRVACTFHFDPSKAPFSYEHAQELKAGLEEDAAKSAEDAARRDEAHSLGVANDQGEEAPDSPPDAPTEPPP